jgi:hypothetical protein
LIPADLLGMVLLLMVVTAWDLNALLRGSANNTLSELVVCIQDSWDDASLRFLILSAADAIQIHPLGQQQESMQLCDF